MYPHDDFFAKSNNVATIDIYHNERLSKSRAYLVTQASPAVYNLFNVVDKNLHRSRRRIVAQGLNERAFRHFEPVVQEQIEIYLQKIRLSSQTDRPVDMSEHCKMLTLDVSGELSFGRSFDLQTSTTYHWLPKALSTSNLRLNVYIQFPAIKYSGWEKLLLPVLLPKVRRFHKMVADMIQTRLAKDKNAKPDLFASISDYKDPETGGDTVASLLAGLFFYLSRYPKVYERLAAEIRDTFHHDDEINGTKLAGCTYLRACLEETLRISPPAATTSWRDLPADANVNPVVVDGHVIPPGTRIGGNIYSIHHNEAYFPSPFPFRRERWLPGESGLSKEQTKLMHGAFMAFSKGARN
ncbi:cytochrome P450 [Karstenula rhodostoma CBS 690.94]|uniref:Cytochrome P450 n=1 Tax=Karstenula rhodostoma CBS 690.94 TaxID=1392251 RepID=A0A9P4PQE2_9PLEO|nr:cytochrome P450 [Karstenula rhodostoma CBS 690.94]